MPKEAVFTMELEPDLREAEAAHRPASQVLREWMREFVQRQSQARAYDDLLEQKVQTAHASIHAGLGTPNEMVEEQVLARRAKVAGSL